MDAATTHPAPRRPASRWVLWFGAVLVLVPLMSMVAVGWVQYGSLRKAEAERLELLAIALEEHATHTVDSTSNTLGALAQHLVDAPQPGLITPLLLQAMAGLPALRGIAVVDLQGTVLGSTVPSQVGSAISLDALGPLPEPGLDGLGNLVRGSGLMSVSRDGAATDSAGSSGFIPLIRHVQANGSSMLLIGMLNPESFGRYLQRIVKDESIAALLVSHAGTVLATLPWVAIPPGTRLLQHPLFSDAAAQRQDHGQFEAAGARPGTQFTVFRVSPTRPLVVLMERPLQVMVGQWWSHMLPLLFSRLAISCGMGVLTFYVWRRLRAYERGERGRNAERAAIAAREREYDELFKLVPELIFRCDANGVLMFVNARYSGFTGHSTEQAIGQPLADLVQPASRDEVHALFDPRRGFSPRRGNAVLEGPYGIERRFDITVVPLYDGELLRGFAGNAVDLTERLQLQEKLRGQVAYTGQLLQLCPVPVSIMDRDLRYVSVNRAWEEFNGRPGSEVVGQRVGHWSPADHPVHDGHDAALLEHGGSRSYEAVYTRIDQSRRHVRLTKVAIPGEDGRPAAILNTFLDVTEFREMEQAMTRARQAAEDVSRLKSDFIASVSHELRTPLQAILGFAEIGLAREPSRERQLALFNEILGSGRGMLMTVNGLLDLAKIEGAEAPQQAPMTDLRDSIEAVQRELDALLAHKRLELCLSLGHRPLNVRLEPARCQQLLRNLVANAIKASPVGGQIEISGERQVMPDGSQVKLQVSDRGPGIPPNELERIFDPFVQSSATKREAGITTGTGLGLAICRKIVASGGGTLHAVNRPGGGASFELSLPLDVRAVAPVAALTAA